MASPLLLVPYTEVRHEEPDDCLHYESIAVRGQEMDWTIPAHRHEGLYQFQMLVTGTARATIDGSDLQVQAPALLMLAPASTHGFTYSPGAVGHQLTIPQGSLRAYLKESGLADESLRSSFVVSQASCAERVAGLFERLAVEFGSRALGRVHALLAVATLIALEFIRERGDQIERHQVQGSRDALVQRFLNLVEDHFAEHRLLDFYSTRLKVTPDHLSRSCRRQAGRSALQLLHDRLMLEARRLLAYTSMPVSHVAQQLGYEDPAYFTKFFGKATGCTPIEYRGLVAQGVRSAGASMGASGSEPVRELEKSR